MRNWIYLFIIFIFGIFVGILLPKKSHSENGLKSSLKEKTESNITLWTCSMHPQIRQSKPGKCPICFMDLIPVTNEPLRSDYDAVEILSSKEQKLAEIEVAPVEREFVEKQIRMVGKIDYDETRIAYITARMPGRIDKLYVNFTGISVRTGDKMAEYYSPDLLLAQRELLLAVKSISQQKEIKESFGYASGEDLLKAVKKKLELWGLTEENINSIIKKGEILDHLTLYSPISGIVIHKNALEGEYFKTGDKLFTIADLSKIWLKLDAYESDLEWLKYGQKVEFTTEAYPGKIFYGRISFISPFVDKNTRTVKIRVNADNSELKLKPEMLVRAIVKAEIAKGGKVIDSSLAGKWISPMHPEIIKDNPGKCDVCGMDLVKAESLGYVQTDTTERLAPLVIPASAPLITGKRAIVYVQSKPGTYVGREIVLGPKAENYYLVESGLKEGEIVVVNGNFKIDSALQILAKPSMMLPGEKTEGKEKGTDLFPQSDTKKIPEIFVKQLDMIYKPYFAIQLNLADDNYEGALKNAISIGEMLNHIEENELDSDITSKWKKNKAELEGVVEQMKKSGNINDFRLAFSNLSGIINNMFYNFGYSGKIFKFHCPMAFDNKGADWFQNTDELANPYFGKAMLKCGEKVEK
ncbi:MAG TPA: efflux RND transporter periplasmic adaptor subunit [Victivallales bacterium]|nr:efflux RND transporter periplasmic adaptor subunit [Victivallales bacterium]